MRDVWAERDLPVLVAYVDLDNEDQDLPNAEDEVAERLGLSQGDVEKSIGLLIDAGYLEGRAVLSGPFVTGVTERGRREAGAWPSPESAADRMIAALEVIAENSDDEDERTRARKVLDAFAGGSRHLALAVVTSVVTGQLPGN